MKLYQLLECIKKNVPELHADYCSSLIYDELLPFFQDDNGKSGIDFLVRYLSNETLPEDSEKVEYLESRFSKHGLNKVMDNINSIKENKNWLNIALDLCPLRSSMLTDSGHTDELNRFPSYLILEAINSTYPKYFSSDEINTIRDHFRGDLDDFDDPSLETKENVERENRIIPIFGSKAGSLLCRMWKTSQLENHPTTKLLLNHYSCTSIDEALEKEDSLWCRLHKACLVESDEEKSTMPKLLSWYLSAFFDLYIKEIEKLTDDISSREKEKKEFIAAKKRAKEMNKLLDERNSQIASSSKKIAELKNEIRELRSDAFKSEQQATINRQQDTIDQQQDTIGQLRSIIDNVESDKPTEEKTKIPAPDAGKITEEKYENLRLLVIGGRTTQEKWKEKFPDAASIDCIPAGELSKLSGTPPSADVVILDPKVNSHAMYNLAKSIYGKKVILNNGKK